MSKNQLGNPAVIAAIASTPQGQKAINKALESAGNATNNTLIIVKNVLWIGLFCTVGFVAYKRFFNNFSKINQDIRYQPAKINDATAIAKAEIIFRAMYGAGNGYSTVKSNLTAIYHNDFIKIYNAFGNRKGINPLGKEMNLIEWIQDEFTGQELINLRFTRPDFF